MIHRLGWSVLFAVAFIVTTSCTSKKHISEVQKVPVETLLDSLQQHQKQYSFFECKSKLKCNGEESKIGGRMHVRMIKDSLVWLNFKKLSVEGARALVTKDSTWILYRLDDLYQAGQTVELLDRLNIYRPFGELQDLMVGNVYIPSVADVKYRTDVYHRMTFERGGDSYEYMFDNQLRLTKIWIQDQFAREVTIELSDYDTENQLYTRREIDIKEADGGFSHISMKLSSITFDVPKSIRFEIPEHYTFIP